MMAMQPNPSQQITEDSEAQLLQENINDLGRIIASEARGTNETAQAMVGWTGVNRMKKAHLTHVSSVWSYGAYAHSHMPTAMSLRIAQGILDGTLRDISQGANYFCSPSTMPKEGDLLSPRSDTQGGLESVYGVTKNGRATRNYRPGWARYAYPIRVPDVPEKDFRFFRYQ